MAKVTLSLDDQILTRAREQADREGMTLSAWMATAARRHALRDAGRRYQAWLDANPDIREEVRAWEEFAARNRADWYELSEAA